MALTLEQLESIKEKIHTDKISPMKAIRMLFPSSNFREVRDQLYDVYDQQDLLTGFRDFEKEEEERKEKIKRIDIMLQNLEVRKAKLLIRRQELQK